MGTFQKMDTSVANSKLSSAKKSLLSGKGSRTSAFRQEYFDVLENDNSSSKDLEKNYKKMKKAEAEAKKKAGVEEKKEEKK